MSLRDWLAHPRTRGLDLDDPRTTLLRREIIRGKPFLFRIYQEWYTLLAESLSDKPVLEIGSGGGFLQDYIPALITSEIFPVDAIDVVLNAHHLPFANDSLGSIVMNNVLHHIPQPRRFFREAARCVRPGGIVAINEPWVTGWSKWVYRTLHHEPFDPTAPDWELPSGGPLSGANGALPWIMFERDRAQFEIEFPEWRVAHIQPHMPFRYLVSGGVSMRSLMPGWSHSLWKLLELFLTPWSDKMAMFAVVKLVRN